MPITLYKVDFSPPVRAAMMAVEIIGLPVEFKDVDVLSMEHRSPEHTKRNPLHTVPYLDDNGFIIHDRFIDTIRLLLLQDKSDHENSSGSEREYNVEVNPAYGMDGDEEVSGLTQRQISGQDDQYYAAMEGVRTPAPRLWDDVREAYDFMEAFLNKSKYLALSHMTIADIAAFASVTGLNHLLPMDTKKYPKTDAWLKEMKKQPFAQKINEPGDEIFGQIIRENVDLESAFR